MPQDKPSGLAMIPDLVLRKRERQPRDLGDGVLRLRTVLSPKEEIHFQQWYRQIAKETGISTNPDDPAHFYDYRGAYVVGLSPTLNANDDRFHWPSEYKDDDHPNRFVVENGKRIDSRTGEVVR